MLDPLKQVTVAQGLAVAILLHLQADAPAERAGCIAEEQPTSDAEDEELRPSFLR